MTETYPAIRTAACRPVLKDLHPPGDSPGKLNTCALQLPSVEQIYQEYAPRVYNTARRMVATDTDAEDVTQDVLLQVLRKLPSFRGDSAFTTWLHRITINAVLSHRRRQAIRQEHGLCNSLETHQGEEPCSADRADRPDDRLLSSESRQLIDRAINNLPPAYRQVFLLADIEGLANAAIAEQLNMSLAAVKSRLHRARAMLREELTPYFQDNAV
jgi:RNA polymerase sigma-70 factor (ECF subfamily)